MHTPRKAYNNVSKDTLAFIESTSHTPSRGFHKQMLADAGRECSQQAGPEHPWEVWHQCVCGTQDRSHATVGLHINMGGVLVDRPTSCTIIFTW